MGKYTQEQVVNAVKRYGRKLKIIARRQNVEGLYTGWRERRIVDGRCSWRINASATRPYPGSAAFHISCFCYDLIPCSSVEEIVRRMFEYDARSGVEIVQLIRPKPRTTAKRKKSRRKARV